MLRRTLNTQVGLIAEILGSVGFRFALLRQRLLRRIRLQVFHLDQMGVGRLHQLLALLFASLVLLQCLLEGLLQFLLFDGGAYAPVVVDLGLPDVLHQ